MKQDKGLASPLGQKNLFRPDIPLEGTLTPLFNDGRYSQEIFNGRAVGNGIPAA